jgi:hypothetical protein
LAQLVEFAQQRPPFHHASSVACKVVKALLHQEGKEGAEDVAADCRIG